MKSYHHGDLRRALIQAALELVSENGPSGFTLSEAARRAGVSKGAPYRHFASKDALLAEIAPQGFDDLHAHLVQAGLPVSDPLERIAALSGAYVTWAVEHPAHYQIMFGTGVKQPEHTEWAAAGERAFGVLITAIVQGQVAGLLKGDAPLTIAVPVWSLLHGLTLLYLAGDLEHVGVSEPAHEIAARSVGALLRSPDVQVR